MKKKILWFILHIEETISIVGLSGMLLFTIFNVIMRYVFDSPRGWATELAVIFLVWSIFPGAAACHKRNLHYGMDFLANRLPENIQFHLRQALMGICVILFALLAYIAIVFTARTTKNTSFFLISYKFINSSAIVGFLSMTIYSVFYFIKSFLDPGYFKQYYANAYKETDDMTMELEGEKA
jgi:TRAP-type C4-dicarboxylate transport system permease small subunit